MRSRPVMFRAGGTPRGFPALTPDVTRLADISEFQPDIADAAYLAWSKAIVIRAMYGDAHDDLAWYGGARRADLWAGGAGVVLIYQYLVSWQSPVTQAEALCRLVGPLRQGGEMLVADIEEGTGNLAGFRDAWMSVVKSAYPWMAHTPVGRPWDYSGLFFAADHGLQPVDWLADYTSAEPSVPHKMWQFTDAATIPGIPGPVDCSVFHGTVADLKALITPTSPPPPPSGNWTDTMIANLPLLTEDNPANDPDLVFRAQWMVKGLGVKWGVPQLADLKADGSYGPATASAFLVVKERFGIAGAGTVPAFWAAIYTGHASTP